MQLHTKGAEHARILQGVFALDDALHYHMEAANAYEQLLSRSSIKHLSGTKPKLTVEKLRKGIGFDLQFVTK